MSYLDFENEGVKYRLILSRHGSKRKEPIDGLDALVIETGQVNPKRDIRGKEELYNYFKEIQEKQIHLFSVDNKGRSLWANMTTSVGHIFTYPAIAYAISKLAGTDHDTAFNIGIGAAYGELAIMALPSYLDNSISKIFAKANSVLSLFRQAPREELRNAISARKIKKGVVPYLLKKYPDRFEEGKLKIGIIYGSGHSGIKECLESDLRSSLSLALHKHYGLSFILDKKTLKDFYEYKLDNFGNFSYQKLQVHSI